jgi:hypothetical protein
MYSNVPYHITLISTLRLQLKLMWSETIMQFSKTTLIHKFLLPNFRVVMPCRLSNGNWHFGVTYHHNMLSCWFLCSVYFLTLKMGAVNSSEMSDDFQQTTGRYPEGRTHIISVWPSTHSSVYTICRVTILTENPTSCSTTHAQKTFRYNLKQQTMPIWHVPASNRTCLDPVNASFTVHVDTSQIKQRGTV